MQRRATLEVDNMTIKKDLRIRKFLKHGGKKNRNVEVRRMEKVCEFNQIKYIDQLGSKHIIAFYKANRDLSDATLTAYNYALKHLYKLLGRTSRPPKPNLKSCKKRE